MVPFGSAGVPVRLPARLAVQLVQVPVALVMTTADGVPRAGVTSVGDVAATGDPVPVVAV